MKKVFIIDDSALMRRVMSDIIKKDSQYEVTHEAKNGLEGYELIQQNQDFDIILLDINMPKMDGVTFLRNIEPLHIKAKIIVVSSIASKSTKETIEALELGAFDFIKKPSGYISDLDGTFETQLLEKIHVALGKTDENTLSRLEALQKLVRDNLKGVSRIKQESTHKETLAVIACSTGGPKSLQEVIPKLPSDLPCPVVVVQHMPQGFTRSLANRLDEMSKAKVVEAQDKQVLEAGVVYICKGGHQCHIIKNLHSKYQFQITNEEARNGLKPCADVILESIIETDYGRVICAVMTGMGEDATRGLAQLKKFKDTTVIGQDEETCVVYGMPRAVKAAGLVDKVVPLTKVAETIIESI